MVGDKCRHTPTSSQSHRAPVRWRAGFNALAAWRVLNLTRRVGLILALVVGFAGPAPATASTAMVDLADRLAFLADPEGTLALSEVRARADAFQPWSGPGAFNQGYTDTTYWLRFPASALPATASPVLLEVGYFSLERVALFGPDGRRWTAGLRAQRSGPFWPHRYPVFRIDSPASEGHYYLRVRSRGSLTVPLKVWSPESLASRTQERYVIQSLYFGGLAALVLFNFLLFLAVRDSRYLLYVLYAGLLGVGMLSLQGLGDQFLWPRTALWSTLTSTVAFSLAGVFALAFTQRFLATRHYAPRLHWVLAGCAGLLAVNAGLPGLGEVQLAGQLLSMAVPPITVVILVTAIVAYGRGSRGARFFLLAWAVLLVGSGIAGLRNLGWLPTNAVTSASLAVGSALEMILLSLALADRINQERAARVEAQRAAARTQERLAEAEASQARRLEQRVADRTRALRSALDQQQATLRQYVRFGAFLAHELRNPLGIIQSQTVLAQKEAARAGAAASRRLDAIAGAAARLQVLFDEWLASDRLQQTGIVPDIQPVALGPWLTEWLPIAGASHRHHVIQLGDTGHAVTVAADDSLLRIVLFNLIDNACKYAPPEAPVHVQLVADTGLGGFAVIDAGPGMDRAKQARIFDNYVRSTDNGQTGGLGLGLALVKQIVERLDGQITVVSELGAGSRFTVWLPLAAGSAVTRREEG